MRTPTRTRLSAHTRTPIRVHLNKFFAVPLKTPTPSGRRIQIRRSGVHGKGVFARLDIAQGETIIEYVGEVISWQTAQDRHPHDPQNPHHTFYFHIDEHRVIDAKFGGNASRWINHACDPNCEADEQDGRIFIKALRDIPAGTELHYDYGLIIDEPYTPALKADYPCWCGAANCRGTLLAHKKPRRAPTQTAKAARRAQPVTQAKAKASKPAKPEGKTQPTQPEAKSSAKSKTKAGVKAGVKALAKPQTPSAPAGRARPKPLAPSRAVAQPPAPSRRPAGRLAKPV